MNVNFQLDDLDFSPCSTRLVSIGKDGLANIWSSASRKPPLLQLTCTPPNGNKYLFRRCRCVQVAALTASGTAAQLYN